MKLLIVGSGPSAYASLLSLSLEGHEIYLADNSNILGEKKSSNCLYNNNFISGARVIDRLNIYDDTLIEEGNDFPLPSKSFGGFSNVWGGTMFAPTNFEVNKFSELNIDIKYYYEIISSNATLISSEEKYKSYEMTHRERKIYSNLKSLNKHDLEIYQSTTWLSKEAFEMLSNKNICNNCKSYKWDCNEEKIWNAKSFIKDKIDKNLITYYPNTKFESFTENNNLVDCQMVRDNKLFTESFDKVFLCAGALSTTSIIMKSTQISNVEMKNSDMISFPYLSIYRRGRKRHSLSDIFITSESENIKIFAQLYGYSKGLLTLANDAIPLVKYIKKLPNFIFNNFGGVFLFFNDSISSNIKISKTQKGLKLEKNNKSSIPKIQVRNIRKSLIKSGVIPLLFLKKYYDYGKSNHYGGQFPHSNRPDILSTDRLGRIKGIINVHIMDSSVLPTINTGPITGTIMANSFRITEEIFKKTD